MNVESSQGETKNQALLRDVLVVDADPKTSEAVQRGLGEGITTVRSAASSDQASLEMKRRPADLLLVNLQVNDNGGLELLTRLRRAFPQTEAIAVSRSNSSEAYLQAWRAGASDILVGPLEPAAIQACILRAEERRQERARFLTRNGRLRNVCRQLNKARHEISQQVDLLCHDLVKAYQELAEQLNQTQVCGEYAAALGDEVEIEAILRLTMEWILKKLGPVNAAVFLPDSENNYTLGAYLNFDTSADSVLVDVVAQTVVPQAAEGSTTLVLHQDSQIDELFGKEGKMLLGRTWLGCGAYYHNECLAVLTVFRNHGEEVDPVWCALLESIAPILGERIARAVRMYQRGMLHGDETPADDPEAPPRHEDGPLPWDEGLDKDDGREDSPR